MHGGSSVQGAQQHCTAAKDIACAELSLRQRGGRAILHGG
jgi:hypothetical protein